MYPITDALKKRFESGERKKAWITLNNASVNGLVITEEDIKADSFSVDRYCATGNKIEIGSAVSSEFSVVLNNANGKFDGIVFEGSVLCVDVGFGEHADGNYVRCGFFTVDEPPRAFSTISLKALDYMMLYDKTVDRTKLTEAFYTPETLVRKISELCGVAVSSRLDFKTLPNNDQSAQVPESATTYRQLLQWVAQLTGTCAYIDGDGELMMSWFVEAEPSVNITPTLRYSGDVLENDIEISGVAIKTATVNVLKGSDRYPLIIESNGFVVDVPEEGVAYLCEKINEVVGGFVYRPYECTCLPMPYLFPLDRITYTDKSGKEISTVVTNHRFGLNSTSSLAAQGETQQKKSYASQHGLTKAEVDSAIAEAMKNFDSSAEHFYVKYSAYEKGRDTDGKISMFDKVQADTAYLGTCATDSKTPPENPEDYNWVKIRPEDGEPGRGVVSVKTQYYRSTSSVTQTGGSWTDTMPVWVEGTYLWKREVVTYENPSGTKTGTPILDTSWDAIGDIKEDASDAKNKASAVESATDEFNKSLLNALGFHVTDKTVAGTTTRYYHSKPNLVDCGAGDIILIFNSGGFGVCTTGWNGGNPTFTNGADFKEGKFIWDILTANKINADLIEAGKIKSVDGAGVQTSLDLDTGTLSFKTDGLEMFIDSAQEKTEAEDLASDAGVENLDLAAARNAGIKMYSSVDGTAVTINPKAFLMCDQNFVADVSTFIIDVINYILGKGTKPDSSILDSNYVQITRNMLWSTNISCKTLTFKDTNGTKRNIADAYSDVLLAKESISAMQEKIRELESALGQQHTHTNASAVRENIVEATCTSGGSYDSVVYCATCPEEISRTTITTSALGHSWRDATCTSPKTCTRCGATQGSALGHADSDNDGYCDRCNNYIGGNTYNLTLIADPSNGGTVSGGGSYVKNSYAQIKATANAGYEFAGWYENGILNSSSSNYSALMNGDRTLTAKFKPTSGGSGEVRLITSVGGGSGVAAITKADGEALGYDLVVSLDSDVYIFAVAENGWIIDYYEVYKDGVYVFTVTREMISGQLMFDGQAHQWQPAFDSSDSGLTCEVKYYFEQA